MSELTPVQGSETALPLLGDATRARVLGVWRLAAARLVPEAALPGQPLDPSRSADLAARRLLQDADLSPDIQGLQDDAQAALRRALEAKPAEPVDRLTWAGALLDLDARRQAVLEAVGAAALDPELALVARWVAGRLGHGEALSTAALDDVLAAAGVGAAVASTALLGSGSLLDCGLLRKDRGALVPTAALLRFLLGPAACASDLAPFVVATTYPAAFQAAAAQQLTAEVAAVAAAMRSGRPLVLSGSPGFGGDLLVRLAAETLGLGGFSIDAAAIFDSERGLPTELLPALRAEAHLSAAVWCLDGLEKLEACLRQHPRALVRLADALQPWRRPLVFLHQGPLPSDLASQLAQHTDWLHLEVPALAAQVRVDLATAALSSALGPAKATELAEEARGFSLALGAIVTASAHALHKAQSRAARQWTAAAEPAVPTPRDMRHACSAATTSRLRQYGSRVDTTATWDDLVLAAEPLHQVKDLARFARVRDRLFETYGFGRKQAYGRALSALFSGPSGTGKTMVAGLIARDLGVELYRVDLSRVVSKYIGETEERLGALFTEASQVGAALLFDEADSMFGSRTEIKSSNDRYANLEVNYLLQRLEEYEGVVILTTNFAASIDEAFVRRLRFRVQFPFPTPKERARLWEVMLPDEMPQDDAGIDFDWLGETFELSGGHVRNAVLRGAMIAADADKPLTNRMMYDAAAAEYRELGKLAPAYPFDDEW